MDAARDNRASIWTVPHSVRLLGKEYEMNNRCADTVSEWTTCLHLEHIKNTITRPMSSK